MSNSPGPDVEQMMNVMTSPDGLKNLLLNSTFEDEETGHEFSQAHLLADLINILRMDTKRIGKEVGVEMEVSKMTPERAAELIQGITQGEEGMAVIQIFDEIEEQRMDVLTALSDNDTVEEYMKVKRWALYTTAEDPGDEVSVDTGGNDED